MPLYMISGSPKKETPNKVAYETVDGAVYVPKHRLRELLELSADAKGKAPSKLYFTVSTTPPDGFSEAEANIEFEL